MQTDPIPLSNRARLVIGGVVCFFLLPSRESQSLAVANKGNGTSEKDPIVLSSDEDDDEHVMDYF